MRKVHGFAQGFTGDFLGLFRILHDLSRLPRGLRLMFIADMASDVSSTMCVGDQVGDCQCRLCCCKLFSTKSNRTEQQNRLGPGIPDHVLPTASASSNPRSLGWVLRCWSRCSAAVITLTLSAVLAPCQVNRGRDG
jgi:hypothetical protein